MSDRTCTIDGCSHPMAYTTLAACRRHYLMLKKRGSTEPARRGPAPIDPEMRFWPKVEKRGADECWPYRAAIAANGYGVFNINHQRQVKAHRYAYELLVGPIPEGMTLDHLCHTRDESCVGLCEHRRCVNPAHLEPVDSVENVRRGRSFSSLNAAKTTRIRGHDISTPDGYYVVHGTGRACRACDAMRYQAKQARLRGDVA